MIIIGSDHGGFELKQAVTAYFDSEGIEYFDYGVHENVSVDYPDIAFPIAEKVAAGEYEKGMIFCGTGIGVSICANKVDGVRAALCTDHFTAEYCRLHNDANILCIGGRVTGVGTALDIVKTFLSTDFEGGRHERRVAKIMAYGKDKY